MNAVREEQVRPSVDQDQLSGLQQAVSGFDRDQLIWSSGFLAGLAQSPGAAVEAIPIATGQSWDIYFATETGNSARVARELAEKSKSAGISVELHDLRDVRPRTLAKVRRAVFVLATHGVGDPPEGTEAFFTFWHSDKAPQLENLDFGVIALGDSSYADFCEVGRRFEARLMALGARAVLDRSDCDLDFDKTAADWSDRFVEHAASDDSGIAAVTTPSAPVAAAWTRSNPYTATILANQKITGRHSTKDVRHIELDLEGAALSYLPGDSLGVHPINPPELVERILSQAGLDAEETVSVDGDELPLAEALSRRKEITLLSRPVLDAVAERDEALASILGNRTHLASYLSTRQLTDLLAEVPRDWQAQDFVDALRGLTPRLYSIASSPLATPDEAHLTVAVVRYDKFGRPHWGTASNFLTAAERVPVYVEANERFRLPADGSAAVVMIGAGTGVAPFRAFIEHRRELGHGGRNWLLFGDRHRSSDFLYQLEWLRHRKDGLLTALDVAFSRDQTEKVYVQHRLRERGRELFAWLEDGAHLYVCGDAERMAPDVDQALADVVREHGGVSAERAADYLADLKRAGRYQRDVY